MTHECTSPDALTSSESSPIKATIIYEDFASGVRAKQFAERLAEELGGVSQLADSLWRSDLLESWPIANAATRAASDSDYFIVSLCGEHVLPSAARDWIETQLGGAGSRGAVLIVLSDSNQGRWRVVEGTRHYFRSVCAANDVAFFSHTVTAPATPAETDSWNDDETEAVSSKPALLLT